MRRSNLVVVLAMAGIGACANPDTAVFVTSTSLGINVDSKPPTVAVAYERVEGFVGPRYGNGGAPPVIASTETTGDVFAPRIRQTYATGAAAVAAAGDETAQGPKELVGDRRLMYFGTATTIGFKVGFGPEGAPDSLVLGYKRKEASVIPIGEMDGKAVYPSVFASIDTTSKMEYLPDAGFANKQFFATGQAAEKLAKNKTLTAALEAKSTSSILDSLSPKQREAAETAGRELAVQVGKQLDAIALAISCDGKTIVPAASSKLVTAAGAPPILKDKVTVSAFKDAIVSPTIADNLFKAAEKQGRPTCPQ